MMLKVKTRNTFGKKNRLLRQQGFIPAELYGHNLKNIHLSVPKKDFQKILNNVGGSAIINLIVEDKDHSVFIQDVQRDCLTQEFLNIDFHQIKKGEKVRIFVPLKFIEEAPAVKTGGLLIKTIQEVELEGEAIHIPPCLEVNLSVLDEIGKNILIKDLCPPDETKLLLDKETVIASIIKKKEETKEVMKEKPAAEEKKEEKEKETVPEQKTTK